jgi:hypothetical protein
LTVILTVEYVVEEEQLAGAVRQLVDPYATLNAHAKRLMPLLPDSWGVFDPQLYADSSAFAQYCLLHLPVDQAEIAHHAEGLFLLIAHYLNFGKPEPVLRTAQGMFLIEDIITRITPEMVRIEEFAEEGYAVLFGLFEQWQAYLQRRLDLLRAVPSPFPQG